MKKVRLLPLLALAALFLVALKAAGLFFSGGYMLSGSAPASAQNAQAESDAGKKADENQESASAAGKDDTAAKPSSEPRDASDKLVLSDKVEAGPAVTPSGAELEVLKSLSKRRESLDQRARELKLHENLLKAAEERVKSRITELQAIEKRIESELTKRDKARDAEYAKLVTLYSTMKPKKAARIFNQLEVGVLTDLVRRMKPRTIAPIFAAMEPAVAERVTLEIARRDEQNATTTQSLPKIGGQATN